MTHKDVTLTLLKKGRPVTQGSTLGDGGESPQALLIWCDGTAKTTGQAYAFCRLLAARAGGHVQWTEPDRSDEESQAKQAKHLALAGKAPTPKAQPRRAVRARSPGSAEAHKTNPITTIVGGLALCCPVPVGL